MHTDMCVQDRLQTRCTQCRRYGRKLQSMMQDLQGLARATIAAVQLELKKKAPPVSEPIGCVGTDSLDSKTFSSTRRKLTLTR